MIFHASHIDEEYYPGPNVHPDELIRFAFQAIAEKQTKVLQNSMRKFTQALKDMPIGTIARLSLDHVGSRSATPEAEATKKHNETEKPK